MSTVTKFIKRIQIEDAINDGTITTKEQIDAF